LVVCMSVLPQGFCAAPLIANTLSIILTLPLTCAIVWVDNILILGYTASHTLADWLIFKSRCQSAGAVLKPGVHKVVTRVTYVGYL